MTQRVSIKSTAVEVRTGVGKKSGAAYEMREQTAYLDTGHDFPDRFKLQLDKGQQPYPVGEYYIANPLVDGEFSTLAVARHLQQKLLPPAN